MSYSDSFSNSYCNNHVTDDSSTVFDADTVMPDEVPSLPPLPPLPPLPSVITTEYHQQQAISSTSSHESPATTISELLRRINSRHPAMPIREEISTNHQPVSSSSSSNRLNNTNQETATATKITDSSSHSMKQPRRSSRLQQLELKPQDQSQSSAVETPHDSSGVEDEDDEPINEEAVTTSSKEVISITHHEVKWRNKFEELCDYKRLHGHAYVPRSNTQLGNWVAHQRQQYKMFQKQKNKEKIFITRERIDMLDSIGFEWVITNPSFFQRKESEWNKRFNELKEYKELYGDTNVPDTNTVNKKLGKWVSHQRHHYKVFNKKNGKSQITTERIQMLDSIGFEWVSPVISMWNRRFSELSAYKEKYGCTNVPHRWEDNKELGVWVSTQRTEYKKFKKNRKGKITLERIQMLESLDFEWVSPNKGGCSRNESKWNKRFNELKEYKEKYERTDVPQNFKDNKQLGLWVSHQRTQYKKFQANKKSQITPERIDLLNSIGFQWECCPARAPRS